MSRRRATRSLGESLSRDPSVMRIYGRDVLELGSLVDLVGNWTDRSLSTALCLCLGKPGLKQVEDLAGRIRRPVPSRGPFSAFLAEHHGVSIDPLSIDRLIIEWAGNDASKRMLSVGLLATPIDLQISDLTHWYESLKLASGDATPMPLSWAEAMAVAEMGRSQRMSFRSICQDHANKMTAWDVLGALAETASVSSDRDVVRTRAAIGSLASGIAADEDEGIAAVLLLILSSATPRFDEIPFGLLRTDKRPVGPLIAWLSDLYVQIGLSRLGRVVSRDRVDELLDLWPFERFDALPLAVSVAGEASGPWTESDLGRLRALDPDRLLDWASAVGLDGSGLRSVPS